MPIEIRELQITAVIQDEAAPGATATGSGAVNTEAIVRACVEQVLEILEQKTQR